MVLDYVRRFLPKLSCHIDYVIHIVYVHMYAQLINVHPHIIEI
jgi:hypothetical protein